MAATAFTNLPYKVLEQYSLSMKKRVHLVLLLTDSVHSITDKDIATHDIAIPIIKHAKSVNSDMEIVPIIVSGDTIEAALRLASATEADIKSVIISPHVQNHDAIRKSVNKLAKRDESYNAGSASNAYMLYCLMCKNCGGKEGIKVEMHAKTTESPKT